MHTPVSPWESGKDVRLRLKLPRSSKFRKVLLL